jgi:hypothetical protein
MTPGKAISEVVKTPAWNPTWNETVMPVFDFPSACRPASAWWRRLNANPAVAQAYQRTSKGLFQP